MEKRLEMKKGKRGMIKELNLRDIFPGHQKQAFAKAVSARNLYEEVESRSFEEIGVKVIWVDLFEEIPEFINNMCAN